MANEIKYEDVVKTLEAEVGYQGQHYNSKFTEYLDNIVNSDGSKGWYNYPKKNACTWCCILADYAVAVNKGNLSFEQAREICCEPYNHNSNAGAGVKEMADYFKSKKRWISKSSDATTGDRIFLNNLNHVGTVVGWDKTGLFYIDGSTTYEGKPYSVGKKHIPFNSSKIVGFGRPDWYKFQTPDVEEPTPAPEKPTEPSVPAPSHKTMTVKVNTVLNVRSTPNGKIVDQLKNGTKVTIYEEANGWARIGDGRWVFMQYLR